MTKHFAVDEKQDRSKDQPRELTVVTTGTPQPTPCCDSSCCGGK